VVGPTVIGLLFCDARRGTPRDSLTPPPNLETWLTGHLESGCGQRRHDYYDMECKYATYWEPEIKHMSGRDREIEACKWKGKFLINP
jgi:hypothetical protein